MIKLTVEKEQKLAAMLAAWILRKGAKRLGPKAKARLATKVGTCVDNVQYHWERYKREHFKKVRWAILPSNDLFCEKKISQASSAVPAPAEEVKQNISWKTWKDKKLPCVNRSKRNGKEVFDHKCDGIIYDGWPAARAALLLLSDHELIGLSQVLLLARLRDDN